MKVEESIVYALDEFHRETIFKTEEDKKIINRTYRGVRLDTKLGVIRVVPTNYRTPYCPVLKSKVPSTSIDKTFIYSVLEEARQEAVSKKISTPEFPLGRDTHSISFDYFNSNNLNSLHSNPSVFFNYKTAQTKLTSLSKLDHIESICLGSLPFISASLSAFFSFIAIAKQEGRITRFLPLDRNANIFRLQTTIFDKKALNPFVTSHSLELF